MKHARRLACWTLLVVVICGFDHAAYAAPQPSSSAPDCGTTVVKPSGQAWRCTFADDFDGTKLDPARWQPLTTESTNLRGTDDCWVSGRKNIAVSDGHLRLTSRREESPFNCQLADGSTDEAEVSSGSVTTYGKFAQAFGRWDIRARFPNVTLPGSHGALWLTPYRNTYGEWPASGEIDIAEFYSLYPDRVVPYVHYKPASTDSPVTNTQCYVADPWKFHTYSTVWTSGRIVISVDGVTCVDHTIRAAIPLTGAEPFDQPFVLNLTQTRGVGTNAPIAGTPLPLTTVVDYVRVWS